MLQSDLFDTAEIHRSSPRSERPLDLAGLLDRLAASCARPRYNFALLTLIAHVSADTGEAGPFIHADGKRITVRDWLCDAMISSGGRDPRRRQMIAKVRRELAVNGALPSDTSEAEAAIRAEVRQRLRRSGRTNVSRAVTELVHAGMLNRYYRGDYVDHHNRGGRRHAVYMLTDETRRALTRNKMPDPIDKRRRERSTGRISIGK